METLVELRGASRETPMELARTAAFTYMWGDRGRNNLASHLGFLGGRAGLVRLHHEYARESGAEANGDRYTR